MSMKEQTPFDPDAFLEFWKRAYPKQTAFRDELLAKGLSDREIGEYKWAMFELQRLPDYQIILGRLNINMDVEEVTGQNERIILEYERKYPFLREIYERIMLEKG